MGSILAGCTSKSGRRVSAYAVGFFFLPPCVRSWWLDIHSPRDGFITDDALFRCKCTRIQAMAWMPFRLSRWSAIRLAAGHSTSLMMTSISEKTRHALTLELSGFRGFGITSPFAIFQISGWKRSRIHARAICMIRCLSHCRKTLSMTPVSE